MSNRYSSNRQEGNKEGFGKTQKKFVPKNHSLSPKEPNPNPNSNPTLSTSMRQSLSKQLDGATSSSSTEAPTTSRVRMGENGEWVSGRAQGGNFVNYLPQDEAVASGLGANEGGLDPVESQRVVDLLNRELSRLLKLSPRNFWTEGTTYYHCVFWSFRKFLQSINVVFVCFVSFHLYNICFLLYSWWNGGVWIKIDTDIGLMQVLLLKLVQSIMVGCFGLYWKS